jgi:hypothetical protein
VLLFEGSSPRFCEEAEAGRLASHLSQRYRMVLGHTPSPGEVRAWRNSLAAFASRLRAVPSATAHVLVEYQLPLSSSRLDCMVLGHDAAGNANADIVELKQWEQADESPFEDCVYVFGEHKLHPSAQVGGYTEYLRDTLSVFQDAPGIDLRGCAYLHNLRSVEVSILGLERYAPLLRDYPIYDERSEGALTERLAERIGQGDGEELFAKVMRSRYRPSLKLLDHTARMIEGDPIYRLLDNQQVAYNAVKSAVEKGISGAATRSVFVVEGGPGSGKSVIAMRLFADMARRGYKVNHATGSKAFTTNVRARVGRKGQVLFRYFNQFMAAAPQMLDLLICDEAHRIRATSNNQYTASDKRSTRSQVEELIAASRVSIFFLDANQTVRPGEVGSTSLVRATAEAMGASVTTLRLESQFRCAGSQSYVEWVEGALGLREGANLGWREAGDFDFRLVDSPGEMERLLRERIAKGDSARMVAGFCWPWSRTPGWDLPEEVVIGDWRKPWNPFQIGTTPAQDAYFLWASTPRGFDQVGCIYSAQGFEWDYVGVIVGPDLVWREGRWVADRAKSEDTAGARREKDPARLASLLENTYRVLFTRGMRGCFVYCCDAQTREHFEAMLRGI